jgi:hypothetical protein
MSEELQALLDHLLNMLDPDRQDEIEHRHIRALNWEPTDRLPVIVTLPEPRELRFTPYPHGEVFENPEKMLFNELVYAFNTSIASRDVFADDLPCTIRANFGTVVIPSMFGACVEQIGCNPPWVRHNDNGDMHLEKVLDHDPLDFSMGWCPKVVQMYQFYRSVLSDYPKLNRLVRVVLPDLQGPFDNLELVVGSDVFAELYNSPDLVSKTLAAMATAQIGFARHIEPYISDKSDTFSHQHATMIKGRILLRNDSVIMMSPEMYRSMIAPHDERVMQELGGGAIHSCGKVDGHIPAFLELPSIRCIHLGQPELNNIDELYLQLEQRHIPLVRVKVSRDDLTSARIMDRFPTGLSLHFGADSIRDAKETLDAYLRATEMRSTSQTTGHKEYLP